MRAFPILDRLCRWIHTKCIMFKRLSDFGYTRTFREAVGFYLAYLLLLIIAGAVAAYLFGGVNTFNNFYAGVDIGSVVAVIGSIIITYLVFQKKKSVGSFSSLLLSLLAGVLAMTGGAVLGLLIPAVITTTKAKGIKKRK
jgi:hypothetical protein